MKKSAGCKAAEAAMPDLLFDPLAVSPAVQAHVAECQPCQAELQAMARTMDVLSTWEAPEPTPFWDARMRARLRTEMTEPLRGWAGWRERLRTRVWLSNRAMRPVTAGVGAFALLLAAGGGAWLEMGNGHPAPMAAVQASNTVRDLQSLNANAQVFQQMSALDDQDAGNQGAD